MSESLTSVPVCREPLHTLSLTWLSLFPLKPIWFPTALCPSPRAPSINLFICSVLYVSGFALIKRHAEVSGSRGRCEGNDDDVSLNIQIQTRKGPERGREIRTERAGVRMKRNRIRIMLFDPPTHVNNSGACNSLGASQEVQTNFSGKWFLLRIINLV